MSTDTKEIKDLEKEVKDLLEVTDYEALEECDDDDDEYDDNYEDGDDEECSGCHWCNPVAHPEEPAPVEALPAGHVIVMRGIMNCWEGGYEEEMWLRTFGSYESASKAIFQEYIRKSYSENYWRKEDPNYEKYEKMRPTIAQICKRFSPAALAKTCMNHNYNLYGRYGRKCCIRSVVFDSNMCKIE